MFFPTLHMGSDVRKSHKNKGRGGGRKYKMKTINQASISS